MWMIVDDFDPPDLSPRWTGWARLTHRPNDATARFEVLSLLHSALLEEIQAPEFNSTAPPAPPRDDRRPDPAGTGGLTAFGIASSPTTATLSASVFRPEEDTVVYFSYQAGSAYQALEPVSIASGSASVALEGLTPSTVYLCFATSFGRCVNLAQPVQRGDRSGGSKSSTIIHTRCLLANRFASPSGRLRGSSVPSGS